MKSIVIGSIYFVSVLISQVDGTHVGETITNVSFAALVYYLVAYRAPIAEKEHRQEREENAKRFDAMSARFTVTIDGMVHKYTESIHAVRQSLDELRDKIEK